jgi:hypothetical protein
MDGNYLAKPTDVNPAPLSTRERERSSSRSPEAGTNGAHQAAHKRRQSEWEKSAHGEALLVGRMRQANWSGLLGCKRMR